MSIRRISDCEDGPWQKRILHEWDLRGLDLSAPVPTLPDFFQHERSRTPEVRLQRQEPVPRTSEASV